MSQNTSSNRQPANMKELLQIAAKPFIFIMFLIMVCAFLAHYLVGSETLEDYARNNPDVAYGSRTQTRDEENTAEGEDMRNVAEFESEAGSANAEISDGTLPDAETPGESAAYNIQENENPNEDTGNMTINPDRITYQDGFYYEPLNDSIKQRITGISYPEAGCTVPYEDLNYVGLLYIDFNGEEQTGELICNKAIAQDMVEIFYELYRNDYRIERVRLVDEYDGDDTLSMLDNNTSCFNYRVVDDTTTLSKHAFGCAIDINPFYNPYIIYNKNGSGETYISPKGSEIYADRSQNFPYKIDENDLCYKLFTEHGFTWGGNWNSTKDYQHFQITLP